MVDLTYDETPARRPGLDDVGGAQFEDEIGFEPIGPDMPASDDFNQMSQTEIAHAKIMPTAGISVGFTAGTPSVRQATGPGVRIVPSTFTVTDNGPGDTTITWPAGTIPSSVLAPMATINEPSVSLGRSITAFYVSNGVRVVTDAAGAADDLAFTVLIY